MDMRIKKNKIIKGLFTVFLGIGFLFTIGTTYASCDNGAWKLIFRHDISHSKIFLTDDDAKQFNENVSDPNSVDRYSRLFELENYRNPVDGKFELKLTYPNKNITNIWKQSSNPITRDTRGIDGYEPISIGSTAGGRGGLEHELGTTTFLDGVPNSATRRWAIGSHRTYGNSVSIPGPGQIVSLVELYVCADTQSPNIDFSTTTPDDNSYTSEDNFSAEFEVTEPNLNQLQRLYNGVGHILYNQNTNIKFDFDNISEIGEIQNTKVVSTSNPKLEGIIHNATFEQINNENGVYSFDENGEYIKIPDNNNLNLPDNYTISLWYYYDDNIFTNNYNTLFQRKGQNSSIGFLWSWFSPSNNNLYFQYANGTQIKTISFPNIKKINQRTNLIYTFDKNSKELKIYINGELKGSQTLPNYINPTSSDLYIGSYHGTHTFAGKLDTLEFYQKIISNNEILNLYNSNLNKNFKYYFTTNGTNIYNFSITQSINEGTNNFQVEGIDNSENYGSSTNRTITKDTINPTATIDYNITTTTNQDIVATINSNETITILNNNGNQQYTFTNNGSFKFEFKDLAGNTGEAIANVNRIDKIEPTGDIEYSFSLATSGTIIATLTGLSENITITNNDGNNEHIFYQNGSFKFEFKDLAGNTGEAIANVNNIYPEYQTELSYNNPLLIFPSEIHNYIRTFSDGINPDKQCIYKTLKIDLGYSGVYAIIPAWTCYTMDGGTTNDLNLYNTIIQKTSNEWYSFLFGKTTIKTYFDKPIKFVFNKNMFSGAIIGSLDFEPNLFIKHIGGNSYLFDSISHSYYANCTNGLSDISNSQLIYYDGNYIGYTCEGGNFKVGFDINGTNSNNNNTGSINTGSNDANNSGESIIYNTYNTYNTYNSSSSSTKKYYYENDGKNQSQGSNLTNDINYKNDLTILVSDELISNNIKYIKNEINKIALKKGIAINQNMLDLYIWGRKNYIITYPYYDEGYLGKNLDKKTLAIMLSRYIKGVGKLPTINSLESCNFNDIDNLDYSSKNYITNSCIYGLFMPDKNGKFNPNEIVKREKFSNLVLKLLGEYKHGSASIGDVNILKTKGIFTTLENIKESRETILTVLERVNKINTKNIGYNKSTKNTYHFYKPYKLGYKGIGVRKLQEFLINYGTFKDKSTGYFGKKTLEALYQFQLKEGILTEDSPEYLRGYMGPGTREAINNILN